jgi:hypothetical protein
MLMKIRVNQKVCFCMLAHTCMKDRSNKWSQTAMKIGLPVLGLWKNAMDIEVWWGSILEKWPLQILTWCCEGDINMVKVKGKVIPLHAMEAHGVRGGIAPTHS